MIHPDPDEEPPPSDAAGPRVADEGRADTSLRMGAHSALSSSDAATPPIGALPAAPVEWREPLVLDVPIAALDKPSATLEPTPSPLPRASLLPTVEDDAQKRAFAPLRSRNVPTVAARYMTAERPQPLRAPAAAVTFPPGRVQDARERRIARRLAADVRSSKREIVLGLAIGMALAAALGLAGQRYLARRSLASAPAPVTSAPGPRPITPTAPVREEWSLRPHARSAIAPSSTDAREREDIAREGTQRESTPLRDRTALRESTEQAAQASPSGDARVRRPRVKVARARVAAPAPAPAAAAPPPDVFSEAPRNPSSDEWMEGAKARAKAPLSPAESAGLGMDLTL